MLIIGVLFFQKVSLWKFSLLSRGWLGVVLVTYFIYIYINGLLCEIEKCPELGVKFSENTGSSLLFAHDFVGSAEIGSAAQKSIDIVHIYSKHRHFEANVKNVCCCNFFESRQCLGWLGLGW